MRNGEIGMTTTAEKKKEYYYANREKCLGWAKGYREKNKKKVRALLLVWRKKNPEKVREYNAKYSAANRIKNDAKRIENEYNEWNDTLRELGYGDLVIH
jgi:DNA-binding transcriptional regulator GbsR (MarR family)